MNGGTPPSAGIPIGRGAGEDIEAAASCDAPIRFTGAINKVVIEFKPAGQIEWPARVR